MQRYCRFLTMLCLGHLMVLSGCQAQLLDFNQDWHFHKGSVAHAEQTDFDDSQWRPLDVPHDWSIEDLKPGSGPLDPCAVGKHNTGYFVGGTGWYRKHFTVDKKNQGQRVHVHFDGVYMNADVWINGHHLGNHPYGYTAFWYDITDHLRFGQDNVLAVEVKNEGANSRWYSGSGIYRPVRLTILNPVHIDHWGPCVTTPHVSNDSAQVRVRTDVIDATGQDQQPILETRILDPHGKTVAETSSSLEIGLTYDQTLVVTAPTLWSPDTPALYQVSQRLLVENKVLEERATSFGIRSISCDPQNGFQLNGKPLLLQGLCMHHDNYMLGSAAYPRAEERRVEIVKAAGYNAIRCAHNPPSTAFLDACDRLGMLVIDEAFDQWTIKKNKQDYHNYFKDWWQRDIASMVLRDRNHPSVVMWSIGNEIPEQRSGKGVNITEKLVAHIKSFDDSRLVTIGANMAGEVGDPLFALLDVAGTNYQLADYVSDHNRVPDRIMYASESFVKNAFDYWDPVETQSFYMGDFVWTGFDYLGEASIGWYGYTPGWKKIGPYPWHLAYCGEIDALGFKRPAAYYRDVLWKTGKNPVSAFVKSPVPSLPDYEPNNIQVWLHPDLHASWSWPEHVGHELEVMVYSVYEEVELVLNGQSLGKQAVSRDTKYTATYQVSYTPGELKAVGYQDGQAQGHWLLKTAGPPNKLHLTADRKVIDADGQDLVYITVEVTDAQGVLVPQANNLIQFKIEGPGVLAGVGNGNPLGNESFQQLQRTVFQGRCMAVLRSCADSGSMLLTATAEGLESDTVKIRTK